MVCLGPWFTRKERADDRSPILDPITIIIGCLRATCPFEGIPLSRVEVVNRFLTKNNFKKMIEIIKMFPSVVSRTVTNRVWWLIIVGQFLSWDMSLLPPPSTPPAREEIKNTRQQVVAERKTNTRGRTIGIELGACACGVTFYSVSPLPPPDDGNILLTTRRVAMNTYKYKYGTVARRVLLRIRSWIESFGILQSAAWHSHDIIPTERVFCVLNIVVV